MCVTVVELFQTKGWTQHIYARDASGEMCPIASEHAECFCLEGALIRVYGLGSREQTMKLTMVMKQKYDRSDIPYVNDNILTSKEEAIELCKEAGV